MRRLLITLCVMGLFLLLKGPLYAGAIINKSNQSADYIRTFSRNAATDAADVMVYNPGGLMKMENGAYLKLDAIYFDKYYVNDVSGFGKLKSDEPSLIPSFFTMYKTDKWAGFFAVTIPGGGGEVDFKDGNYRTVQLSQGLVGTIGGTISNMELKADSVYYGLTLGGAYEINDVFSLGAGVRYINAYKELEGQAFLTGTALGNISPGVKLKDKADGWGGYIGANINPIEPLNIGLTFYTNTALNWKLDVKEDLSDTNPALPDQLVDGRKQREDLPGYIALGIRYDFTPKLKTDVSFTYYLEKSAKLEDDINDRFSDVKNSYEIGVAVEYAILPTLSASLCYNWSDVGIKVENALPENPELDSHAFGGGVKWSVLKDLDLTLGGAYVAYIEDKFTDTMGNRVKYDKTVWGIAFGMEYRFF